MSKQREALQLALEALEDYQANGAPFFKCDSAVSAIREALAEPEPWTPDDMAYRPGGLSISAEQKPIAVVTSQTGDPAITMSWHHEPALPIGTKLYTAPPARKPLTDNELWEMWVESPSDVLRFARAIERAHGIGSET